MRVRWEFAGDETLETPKVQDPKSPWYGMQPMCRMVSNQLNHLLERHMMELDSQILRQFQRWAEKKERENWLIVTLVVFLLLHVREIDAGRIIFWNRYGDPVSDVFTLLWASPLTKEQA